MYSTIVEYSEGSVRLVKQTPAGKPKTQWVKLYSTVQYCTVLYNRLIRQAVVFNVVVGVPALRIEFIGRVHWHKSRTSKSVHIYVKIRQSPEIMKHVNMLVNRDVKGVLYIPVKKGSKAKGLAEGGSHG